MPSRSLIRFLPYLALLVAHIIWGANFVVAKVTLQEFPPLTLAFLRFAFASILIAPFFWAETKKVKIEKIDIPKLIIIGILIITLNIVFFFEGITRTTAINASVLTLIIPIISVILGWKFLQESVGWINILGLLTGLIGAMIIVQFPEFILGNFTPKELLGNFLIILASIVWVIGSIISREMLLKYPSLVVTGIAFLVGTITFIAPAVNEYLQNPAWIYHVTILGMIGLVYMTLLSSISAYFLFEWGLAKTSVGHANLMQYIEPIVATGVAVIILREQITIPFIAGTVLIAAGVYLGTLSKESHHHHKTHRV